MITLILLIFPIVAAFLVYKASEKNATVIAETFALVELAIYVYAQCIYNVNAKDPQLFWTGVWLKDLSINFSLGWDGLTAIMLGLSSAVSLLIVFSLRTFAYKNKNTLYALILLSQAILVGVFSAKDLFVFYFFFEAALIPVYLIANIWGGENASKISFKMFLYTVFGSLFMLVAFVILYMRTQSSDISQIQHTMALMPENTKNFVFWALMLAFCIKMPVFPLHTWQPDAYSESPTPATMLLSALLSKMGVFGVIRLVLPLAMPSAQTHGYVFVVFGIIGLIYGSIIAIQQDSIKRLIAYSSFAHMGLMAAAVLTLSQEGIQGAIFQMVAHGLNVFGLFYIAKLIYERTGTRSLKSLGGITQEAPMLSVAFMIILLGSIALPLTNGFIGEFLMLKSVFDFNAILGAIASLSIIFGAVYMLRYFQKSMFGENRVGEISDLQFSELMLIIPVLVGIFVFGLFPNLILHLSESFVKSLLLNK